MAPPSARMTKQPARPRRYFPGKAEAQSESESADESDHELQQPKAPPPKASSFPSQRKLPLNVSRAGARHPTVPAASAQREEDLEGFVTASESEEDEASGSGSNDKEESSEGEEEEESSSDDEPKKPMLRPTFISKAKRAQQQPSIPPINDQAAEEERRRKAKADEMLKAQLERDAAARVAGRKAWDDDADLDPEDEVDDTDDLDPEAERAAWKLRELKRVRRDRMAIEEKEKEREEIERRRNMTAEEREAEDKAYIEAQKEEREGRGKMDYMQKYFHKGAFFQGGDDQDEDVKAALSRDLAGAKFEDDAGDKAILPEYMRIRDMTRLGKKGRTRYRDLKSEDTGRWGEVSQKRRHDDDNIDDRFKPDDPRDSERTGANMAPVGERRRRDDGGLGDRDGKRPRYD